MTKGDIVLIPFPFTDLSGQKNRPALILSANELDITVAFITSQLKWMDEFDIRTNASPSNGLKTLSLEAISKIVCHD